MSRYFKQIKAKSMIEFIPSFWLLSKLIRFKFNFNLRIINKTTVSF